MNPAPRSGPAAGGCAFGRSRSGASQAERPHPWGLVVRHPCRTRSFTALPVRPWTVIACAGLTAKSKRRTANGERQIADVSRLTTHGVRRRLMAIGFWPVAYGISVRSGSASPSNRPPMNLSGVGRAALAGTVVRHGWRTTSPHGWVHGGSRTGLPDPLQARGIKAPAPCTNDQTKSERPKKTRPEPGFLFDCRRRRDQSPCCFCRCSQRSWASMVRSAVRRASRRSRPISSPVSTQKP